MKRNKTKRNVEYFMFILEKKSTINDGLSLVALAVKWSDHKTLLNENDTPNNEQQQQQQRDNNHNNKKKKKRKNQNKI